MSCCPPLTGLARLAEHPAVVVCAYLAAFTPWGVLYAFDFISSKWRSIRDTRWAGYFHFWASVVPLAYVCFYTHVQRVAKDYKEMSASIAAAVLCIIHILRTLWGLAQLNAFASWNERAFKCIAKMRYMVKTPEDLPLRNRRKCNESAPLSNRLDYGMLVNNSLVDNDLSGAELPVSLRTANRSGIGMRCERPMECSVRWVTAFLCRFGVGFLKDSRINGLLRERKRLNFGQRYVDVAMQAFLQVTVSTKTLGTDKREHRYVLSDFSPLLWALLYRWFSPVYARELNLEEDIFPYGYSGDPGIVASSFRYLQTTVDDAKGSWPVSALNHMDQDDREAVQSISIEHVEFFMLLMEQQGKDWNTYREQKGVTSNFLKGENHNDAVATRILLCQLGYGREKSLEDITNRLPIKKEFILGLLWDERTNKCLLQASVHVDNCAALIAGICGREKGINSRGPSYNNGYPHDWDTEDVPATIFEQQRKVEVYLLQNTRSTVEHGEDEITFDHIPQKMGCVMDFVRSSLASWLNVSGISAGDVNWNPTIDKLAIFEFEISQQDFDEMDYIYRYSFWLRMVWQCQDNLQHELSKESFRPKELQKSSWLMMLCLLGFPALEVSYKDDTKSQFIIVPQNAPQDIHLQVSRKKFRVVSIEMIKPADVCTFRWQDWKDASMGRLAGQSQWMQENEGLNDDRLYLDARPTKLSDPMIVIDRQDTGLPQNLKYWTGWPPFHPRFGRFELGQFNLSEEDLVVSKGMGDGTTVVDISSIDNIENTKFRKIESALIGIANQWEDREQAVAEEDEIQPVR